jgi:hypothetical protein
MTPVAIVGGTFRLHLSIRRFLRSTVGASQRWKSCRSLAHGLVRQPRTIPMISCIQSSKEYSITKRELRKSVVLINASFQSRGWYPSLMLIARSEYHRDECMYLHGGSSRCACCCFCCATNHAGTLDSPPRPRPRSTNSSTFPCCRSDCRSCSNCRRTAS